MNVNFSDLCQDKSRYFQKWVEISGFLYGGKWFYILAESEPSQEPSQEPPFVVVLDQNLHASLCQSKAPTWCGSMVEYAGWATLTGVVGHKSPYPYSVASIFSISKYEFESEGMEGKITQVLFEPEESVFLLGQTKWTNQQVQLIKQIVGGEENLLQIRTRYFDGNRHLLAKWVKPQESAAIVARLQAVGITNIEVKYAEPNDFFC